MVDLKAHRLVLGEFSGAWEEKASSSASSVPSQGPYRLRVTAKGKKLSCALMPNGPIISHNEPSASSGTVGFFSVYCEVCFDYLWVIAAP